MPIIGGMNKIELAIDAAGGVSALAACLQVKPPTVYQWRKGSRPVSPRLTLSIESLFGISRHDLRPDIFGPSPEGERVRESGE